MALLSPLSVAFSVPKTKQRTRTSSPQHFRLAFIAVLASKLCPSLFTTVAAAAPMAPYPVGGFAMCQMASSLHIQGGVAYSLSATYLVTTNQHFRLDLSQSFDSSLSSTKPPVWVNMTSDYSPFQRFHAGACTPDQGSFLTVGNADATSGSGFMMAYSVAKGTWASVAQAVSGANNGGGRAAGRTMTGFALAATTGSNNKTTTGLGVVIGGGWLPPKTNTPSVLATGLTNVVTEADLVAIGGDGSVGSLTWSVAPAAGNGGANVNNNLGPLAGTKVVILPSANGKAVVLGGVTNGQSNGGGLSFSNLPIVDMVSGAVTLQKTQAGAQSGIPPARYGHCVALSADGNTIYMFGGSLVSNDKITNDLYALDTRTWTWSQPTLKSSAVVPPAVRDHQCVMVGDQFLSLLGFNANQAPSSATPLSQSSSGSLTPIPPSPPIYVLSTSNWVWTTQFTPPPGTPAPPTPVVPIDGSKSKISGAGIAFGLIFGFAFLGFIGYLVFSHKRKQKRKADTLLLIEMQDRKKEEDQMEKERQRRLNEQQDAPLPPIPPMEAHTYNSNYHVSDYENYNHGNGYHGDKSEAGYYHPPGDYYQARDPFQNPTYQHLQHSQSQLASAPYYAQAGAVAGQNPFGQRAGPPVLVVPTYVDSPTFVPEEMGYFSPTLPPGQVGHAAPLEGVKVPVPEGRPRAGGMATGARDKTSFIEPASSYR